MININKDIARERLEIEIKRFRELIKGDNGEYVCDLMFDTYNRYDDELVKLYGSMERLREKDILENTIYKIVENSFYTILVEAIIVYAFRYAGYLPKDLYIVFDALFMDEATPVEIENSIGINKNTVYKKRKEIMQHFKTYILELDIDVLSNMI